MVSVCLPSDAFLQHLPSYLGFSYVGRGISLHGCSSKAQPPLLTLDEGYLLTVALPDLQRWIPPIGPPVPMQPPLLGHGVASSGHHLGLGWGVAPLGCHPWPQTQGSSSRPSPLTSDAGSSSWLLSLASDVGYLLSAVAPGLRHGVAPLGHYPWPQT